MKCMRNHCSLTTFIEVGVFSVFALFALVLQVSADAALRQAAQKLKIPDSVNINSYTKNINVELNGNVIKPGDPIPAKNFKSLDFQNVKWYDGDDAQYTLLMLDIDWKSIQNGTASFYNLFTSVNIPGSSISRGQSLVVFDPPHVPCQPSTKHRLVLLALRQEQFIDIADIAYISAPAGPSPRRENFNLDEFIKRHRLMVDAANVFLAIGEANGVCSGGSTIHSLQNASVSMIVMALLAVVHNHLTKRTTPRGIMFTQRE